LNTEELFNAVDKDGNGAIELHEWIEFWTAVKRAGHSEEEISDEVVLFLPRSKPWRKEKLGASFLMSNQATKNRFPGTPNHQQ
jgi:hypothetical protein